MLSCLRRIFAFALVAGALWHCSGERVTQSQVPDESGAYPLGKLAAEYAVVLATVQQDGAPVSGVTVELSRSIAGRAADYQWSAVTDDAGQARIEVAPGNGYYQARARQDDSEIGHWSSIPLNAGYEVALALPIGGRVRITSSAPMQTTPLDESAAAQTRTFVEAAIARYQGDGREATLAYYNTKESIEGDLVLIIMAEGDHTILALSAWPEAVGSNWATHPRTSFGQHVAQATEAGYWFKEDRYNILTGRLDLGWYLAILHDGLIFTTAHVVLPDELAAIAQDYVQEAISYYNSEGRDATVAYYNSLPSIANQFYLFLIDENDLYIAHPIFPHLKGTDIKDVVGSNGYELGKEIAQATEQGHWVQYLWPNPVTQQEEPKATWVIRHDGLIFASGYYNPDDQTEWPSWSYTGPEDYTVGYVNKAIARYQRDGRESMATFYNSVSSFEDEWYLFVIDENDLYIVHPIFSELIGTDIKDVVGDNGYELGKEIAQATEEGHWIEYLWPHPLTLQDAPKAAYAVRHDGLIFASGYYKNPEDMEAHTIAYVERAIEHYKREGRDATAAHYNSLESIDGQWFLTFVDENDLMLTYPISTHLIGSDVKAGRSPTGYEFGKEIAKATEQGQWIKFPFPLWYTAEDDFLNIWFIRYDGLIFSSGYLSSE